MEDQFNQTAEWRRLEGTSGGPQSSLLLKAGSARSSDQVAQGFVLLGLENLQGWRLHKLSRQPAPPPD